MAYISTPDTVIFVVFVYVGVQATCIIYSFVSSFLASDSTCNSVPNFLLCHIYLWFFPSNGTTFYQRSTTKMLQPKLACIIFVLYLLHFVADEMHPTWCNFRLCVWWITTVYIQGVYIQKNLGVMSQTLGKSFS